MNERRRRTMKLVLTTSWALMVLALWMPMAFGHGIPITVTVDENNKLIAANTEPLYNADDVTSGFAQMILVDNEDGAVMDHITFSNSNPLQLQGDYQFTTLPAFSISGMDPNSGL